MNIKSVLSLLTEKDMNAADMTHKLSEAGCGDMQNGIVTVARLSLFAGIFIGSGISLAIEARKKAIQRKIGLMTPDVWLRCYLSLLCFAGGFACLKRLRLVLKEMIR